MIDNLKIKDLLKLVKNNLNFIVSTVLLCSIISTLYIFIVDQYYESYISVYKTNNSDMINNLQGINSIAQTLGVNMDNNSSTFDYYIPDLVDSRSLYEALVLNKWYSEVFKDSVNLIDFWEIDANDGFVSSIFNKYDVKYEAISDKVKKTDKAINILKKRIRITERETGLFLIQIIMKEPKLAMDIANYIATYIEHYISEKMKQISSKDLVFISDRVSETKDSLNFAEDVLMNYQKNNYLEIDTDPVKQLEIARLFRKVEGNQQVYITLKQQLELIKIDHLKEKSIVNILDRGKIHPDPVKPKKILIIILTIIFSFFASIYFLILKNKIF